MCVRPNSVPNHRAFPPGGDDIITTDYMNLLCEIGSDFVWDIFLRF